MTRGPILGWDVGGAHLKRAVLDGDGRLVAVHLVPCALWKGLHELDAALSLLPRTSLPEAPRAPSFVTMTGELVDLWPDRASGVLGLSGALAGRLGADTRFYAGPRGFVPLSEVGAHAGMIASANWHATASALALAMPAGILVDVGSTTCDIIPFAEGRVAACGFSDAERLLAGELVYAGVARTPAMAFGPRLPFRGALAPLMMEYFATAADIYRLTGELPEGADLHPTADGGEKTAEASARRLLRMVGHDLGPATLDEAVALAQSARTAELARLEEGLSQVVSRMAFRPAGKAGSPSAEGAPLVGAGVGRFLVRHLAARTCRPYEDLGALFGMEPSGEAGARPADCAPAVAVARLAWISSSA